MVVRAAGRSLYCSLDPGAVRSRRGGMIEDVPGRLEALSVAELEELGCLGYNEVNFKCKVKVNRTNDLTVTST